jgi:hypothetical protein
MELERLERQRNWTVGETVMTAHLYQDAPITLTYM